MKNPVDRDMFFYVDESGDPTFYDRHGNLVVGKEGCSKVLILGFVSTEDPRALRAALSEVRNDLIGDEYLKSVPSFRKSLLSFHAKDDCPEVREKVFRAIAGMPFKAHFYVARKVESIFRKRHRGKPQVFYDDLVSKLFDAQLHTSARNSVCFAVRGNRARELPYSQAIRGAVTKFEDKWKTKVVTAIDVIPQQPVGEPCLQVIDYMNWAVYRAFSRGEDRYYKFVEDKVSLLVDVYDYKNYPKAYYSKNNPFEVTKISPL
jgi:hypothetical protein